MVILLHTKASLQNDPKYTNASFFTFLSNMNTGTTKKSTKKWHLNIFPQLFKPWSKDQWATHPRPKFKSLFHLVLGPHLLIFIYSLIGLMTFKRYHWHSNVLCDSSITHLILIYGAVVLYSLSLVMLLICEISSLLTWFSVLYQRARKGGVSGWY